jgi:hypothetical protein
MARKRKKSYCAYRKAAFLKAKRRGLNCVARGHFLEARVRRCYWTKVAKNQKIYRRVKRACER